MSAGKAAPAVVQYVVVCLRADFPGHECVRGRAWRGFTAGDEVGARAADCVLDDVCYEEREEHADEPAEDGDVGFVRAGAEEEGPEDKGREGDGAGVDEEPYCDVLSALWVVGWTKGCDVHTETRSTSACG